MGSQEVTSAYVDRVGSWIESEQRFTVESAERTVLHLRFDTGSFHFGPVFSDSASIVGHGNAAALLPRSVHDPDSRSLTIEPRRGTGRLFENGVENDWALGWPRGVPLDFGLDLRNADARLDLGGVAFQSGMLELAATEVELDFTEACPEDPARVLTIGGKVAKLHARRLGNAGIRELEIHGGVGTLRLDFTGAWTAPCRGRLDGGLCEVVLILPKDLACELRVTPETRSIAGDSTFDRDGDRWVNLARRGGPAMLVLEIDRGLGSLTVLER